MKTILTNIFYLLFSVIICQAAPGAFTLVSATPGCSGSSPEITLTWTASTGATSYNIYRNGSIYVQGVTGLTYENVGVNVVAGTTYSYYIYAVNSVAATESGNTLSATAPSNCGTTPQAPTITTQPQNQTVNAGTTATFSVVASGASLNYQWLFNGQIISGAISSILTLNSVTAANDGNYSVVVSNSHGSVASVAA